jgi:hypothetical protein
MLDYPRFKVQKRYRCWLVINPYGMVVANFAGFASALQTAFELAEPYFTQAAGAHYVHHS